VSVLQISRLKPIITIRTAPNLRRYTEVYNKFQELFEQKLSGLLQEKGTTTEEFYASCKEAVQKGNSDREEFLRLILALTDYEMFISVMRDEKARKDSDTSMV